MTDEQINAAIAQACGWTNVTAAHRSGKAPGADYVGYEFYPNYCTDLNAMHEAEKVLNSSEEKMYFANLKEIVGDLIWYRTIGKVYRATARQRAEAFLRTLGKWEPTTEESSAVQNEVQK
jgi:hypothetical protein